MWNKMRSIKKSPAFFLVLSLCLILTAGCSETSDSKVTESGNPEAIESSGETKDEESGEQESAMDTDSAKDITDGEIYEAVEALAEIESVKEMNVEGTNVLYIDIVAGSPDEFIQTAEEIGQISEVLVYSSFVLSGFIDGDLSTMITFLWNEEELRYMSSCVDFTDDKTIEPAYKQSEFFSDIDASNIFDEELDDLYEDYGVSRN